MNLSGTNILLGTLPYPVTHRCVIEYDPYGRSMQIDHAFVLNCRLLILGTASYNFHMHLYLQIKEICTPICSLFKLALLDQTVTSTNLTVHPV